MRSSGVRWFLVVTIVAMLAVLAVACSRASTVSGPEITTINPVIGDASFVAAFGRAPTADDDPVTRIRTHLAYVEATLRARDVSHLSPAQRAARTRTLDHLRTYWRRGEFPASDAKRDLLPTFVDDRGVRCAVAYLAEQELGPRAIEAINARYRNAYLAQIDAPALAAWAPASGLTRDELALVQPSYPPRPARVADLSLTLDYRVAYDDSPAAIAAGSSRPTGPGGGPTSLGMLRGSARWDGEQMNWFGRSIVGLTGGVGWAEGGHLAYDAHAQLGTQVGFRSRKLSHHTGVVAGVGLDAIGDLVERAWTVPVDGFYYVGKPAEGSLRFGVTGGPRFAFAGADRGVGWHGGVAVIARDVWGSGAARALRDVRLELAFDRLADVSMLGLSLTLATRAAFGWWERG